MVIHVALVFVSESPIYNKAALKNVLILCYKFLTSEAFYKVKTYEFWQIQRSVIDSKTAISKQVMTKFSEF